MESANLMELYFAQVGNLNVACAHTDWFEHFDYGEQSDHVDYLDHTDHN